MKNLTLKTETLRVISTADLDGVQGGLVSSARPPVPAPVSSVRPHPHRHHHGPVSSAHQPAHGPVSSVRPDFGPVSSARPR